MLKVGGGEGCGINLEFLIRDYIFVEWLISFVLLFLLGIFNTEIRCLNRKKANLRVNIG